MNDDNALGTVVPVKDVVRLAHARGIKVLVDGAQGAVHLPVDVQDIGCDFYAFTGHKLYGPTGIGVLYARHDLLEAMRPFNGGGEMIREVTQDNVTYGDPPYKFEAGTPSIVQAMLNEVAPKLKVFPCSRKPCARMRARAISALH